MPNIATAPKLHDLHVGDAVRATITGPWWTNRPLVIVELRFDGDVAVVRDAAPFGGGQVTVPADLLTRV